MEKVSKMVGLNANRAQKLFAQALDELSLALKPAASRQRYLLTYLVGNNAIQVAEPDGDADTVFQLIDAKVRNPLGDKGRLPRLLREVGVSGLFPATFLSVEAALQAQSRSDLWFVKERHGAGGKGMQCLTAAELQNYSLQPGEIVQEGLTNLALMDGRKFTARVYVFVWNKQIFLYREGFVVLHGVPFEAETTDYRVHIDHSGYMTGANNVDMAPLSWYADYSKLINTYKKAVAKLAPVLAGVKAASSEERYIMLGIDSLVLDTGHIRFLEVNVIPNFVHTAEINQAVNVPFFKACILTMFHQPAPGLIKIA